MHHHCWRQGALQPLEGSVSDCSFAVLLVAALPESAMPSHSAHRFVGEAESSRAVHVNSLMASKHSGKPMLGKGFDLHLCSFNIELA